MKCNINPTTQSVYTELVKKLGNNQAMAYAMYINIHNSQGNVSDNFMSYFKEKTGKDYIDIMVNNNATETDAQTIYDYYLDTHKSVERTRRTAENIFIANKYGYNFVSDRDAGKKFAGNIMLDFFIEQTEKYGSNFNHTLAEYRKNLKIKWLTNICEYAAKQSNKSLEEIKDGFRKAKDRASYVESILGGEQMSSVAKNLFAVYKELNGTPEHAEAYINEVLQDAKFNDIYNAINKVKSVKVNPEAIETSSELNDINNGEEEDNNTYDPENSITIMNSHGGHFTSFTKHLTSRLRNYFNALPKLTNDNDVLSVDTNNTFGLGEKMDASACTIALYNGGPYDSVKHLIEKVRIISQTLPGFESFAKFAEDLANDNDLAQECLTVFGKSKITKKQIRIKNGQVEIFVSNRRANPEAQFTFDLFNDLRSAVTGIEHQEMLSSLNDFVSVTNNIASLIGTVNSRNTTKNDKKEAQAKLDIAIANATQDVISMIRAYFPTIPEKSIQAYINLNNRTKEADTNNIKLSNIRILVGIIKKIADTSKASYNNSIDKQIRLAKAEAENRALRKEVKDGKWHDADEYVDTNKINAEEIIDKSQNQYVVALVNTLLDFVPVNTSLNSTNAEHNQSTDVINDSYLTRNNAVFSDKEKAKAYGAKKFRSKQNKYNNLLSHHEGINEGMFEESNGEVRLVDREEPLLKFELFDGANNEDTNTAASYARMNSGDYGPSVFAAFFGTGDKSTANYFLRIPSDAPKTYTLRAPRYDTKGLYYVDQEDVDSKINSILQSFDDWSKDERRENFKGHIPTEARIKDFMSIMTGTDSTWIRDMRSVIPVESNKKVESGDEVYVAYIIENNGNPFVYVVKGTYNKIRNGNLLENPEVVSITTEENENGKAYPEAIREQLENYYTEQLKLGNVEVNGQVYEKAKRKIDRTHKVYQQLLNIRKEELLDMAIALSTYLETFPSGEIDWSKAKKGKLPFREGYDNENGVKFFHLGSNGKFADKRRFIHILAGNVFKNSKFTFYKDGKSVNYMTDTMSDDVAGNEVDGLIHLLYGGANNVNGLRIVKDEQGNATDIILNDAQLDTIYNALDRFVEDYAETAIRELSPYTRNINAEYRGVDNIIELAFNSFVTMTAMDDIIEGSTNFYKDIQTFFKRTKEGQGSGVPQGNIDLMATDIENLEDIPDTYLDKGSFVSNDGTEKRITDVFKGTQLEGLHQRNGFRAVTIKNSTQKSFASLANIHKTLVEQYIKAGIPEDKAKNKASDILYGPVVVKDGKVVIDENTGEEVRRGGFSDTKVNDAQSYITFEEFVRRMANRGLLRRYMSLIEKLLDENSVLTADELTEFVQVQKNFYFDLYYDKKYNRERPRQIKNAEFVLIPRFIKGTQLEQVYNLMKENNIDQLNTVETSKASNAEVLTIWDNDGNINDKDIKNFKERVSEVAELYDYKYLYTQQDVPQHMNDENKAGVQIVKKLIDNIPEEHPLRPTADKFFELFVANIQSSFNELLNKLEIPKDENGNIIVDESGKIQGINKQVFFDKIKEEIRRQGLDNNMLDFVDILEGNGEPNMPAITPNVLAKFESVVQSVFNNNITRQTLPGFHAAQITNIGFTGLKGYEKENIHVSKELKYHPNGEGYIEIMVPASAFNFNRKKADGTYKTMDELLAELQAEHLDEIIGYRIPTEGKQSVCNMKIVGLLDDSQGSTIVVPNEWVAQTGSDFDVDSIYTIQASSYIDRTGTIKKIKYKTNDNTANIEENRIDSTGFDKYDYIKYAKRKSKEARDTKMSDGKKEKFKALDESFNQEFEDLQVEESEKYKEVKDIPFGGQWDTFGDFIKYLHNVSSESTKGLDKKTRYINQLQTIITNVNNVVRDNPVTFAEYINEINDFISSNQKILDQITEKYDEHIAQKEDISAQQELKNFANIEKAAIKAGLLSYNDWTKLSESEKNSRDARNSHIVDCMWKILSDPSTLEENVSRSNFDDITAVLNSDYLPNSFRAERAGRTAYNIWDQIKFQEDAMSGAALKGISVSLDGFCSITNRVQPKVDENHQITVVYNKEDIDDANQLEKGFNVVDSNKKQVIIRHDTYGWSGTNRSVVGKLLTAYSSQTTAHSLDAIKEGAIPNVNIYTFTAYKTLVNMGIDYKTAICFIMQPGISRIVKAYSDNKSLYNNAVGNPIHMAIKSIASDLGIKVNSRTGIGVIIKQLNDKYGDKFNELFNLDKSNPIKISLKQEELKNLPINVSNLINRLNSRDKFSSPVEENNVDQLVYDLGIILIFNKIRNTANETSQIARVCNPDKFGAKATVYETRKVFDDIRRCIYTTDAFSNTDVEKTKVLSVDKNGENVHILNAIYPGVNKGMVHVLNDMNPAESSYPSLAAFLKYSTAFSASCAQTVLPTEHPKFVDVINGLTKMLSGLNPTLDEVEYNNFKKYLLAYLFNNSLSIAHPMVYDFNDKMFIPDHNASAFEEKRRVFGYTSNPDLRLINTRREKKEDGTYRTIVEHEKVEIKDINNPTETELEHFSKYSPAQKVQWIKENFEDSGIFQYFKVNLNNIGGSGTYRGMQSISYTDNTITPNVAYELFLEAFHNENPLIKSAAIDIVKYAVQVDGYKMTANGINKVIDNSALYMPIVDGGLGIVDNVTDMMNIINYYFEDEQVGRNIYEQYLRSTPNKNIKTLRLNQQNRQKYNYQHLAYGIYYIANDGNIDEFNSKLAEAGIKEEPITENGAYKNNQYIYVVNDQKETYLYRIVQGLYGVYFYPLNPLQPNETTEYSANPENNKKYPHKDGLELYIQKIEEERLNNSTDITSELADTLAEGMNLRQYYKNVKEVNKDGLAKTFSLKTEAKEQGTGLWQAYKSITEHFAKNTTPIYINNIALTEYITDEGIEYGSQQKVTLPDGTERDVFIQKHKLTKKEKSFLTGAIEDVTKVTDNPSLQKLLTNSKENGYINQNSLYEVREVQDETGVYMSNIDIIDNLSSDGINYLRLRVMSGEDMEAVSIMEKLKRNGVNSSLLSVKENQGDILRELARYAGTASEALRRKIKNFVKDPEDPDKYLSISDKKVQDLLLKDKNLTEDYLRTINETIAFINSFKGWKDYRVETEDEVVKLFVNDIVEACDEIQKLPDIKEAEENFARGYVKEISDNPVIQNQLVDILVGFHDTYGTMWRFHDVLENGVPLLQTILKDAKGNIEARRLQTEKFISNFRKEIGDIIAEAKANGQTVDFNKFITKIGMFVQDFSSEFVDIHDELKDAVEDATIATHLGSIDHLTAKNQFDAFKATYLHQEAKQDYYLQKVNLEKEMLDNYPELYSKYMTLWYQALDIYRSISDMGLNPVLENLLDSIHDKMANLLRPEIFIDDEGNLIDRRTISPDSEEYKIYGEPARTALNNTLYELRQLQEEYFEKKPVHGFETLLKENLKIINDLEERDANGIPKHSQSWLMKNEEYRRAKEWIKNNAKFQVNYDKLADEVPGLFDEADPTSGLTVGQYVQNLLNKLKVGRNARTGVYSRLAKEKKIHDEYGIPDGSKLTNEERDQIRETQEAAYRTNMYPPFSDQSIISSTRNSNNEVYNESFWNSLKSSGVTKEEWIKTATKLNSILKKYYDDIDGLIHFERIKDTKEGRDELKELTVLYYTLARMRKKTGMEPGEAGVIASFIEESVDFVTDEDAYKNQWSAAKESRSGEWMHLWTLVNSKLDDAGNPIQKKDSEGNPVVDRDGHPVYEPNPLIYGYVKPKGERGDATYDAYVDKTRTEAMNVISKIFKKTKTRYYEDVKRQAQANPESLGYSSYAEWYQANHIYNPYTHVVEPIECWYASTYNEEALGEIYNIGEFVPKGSQYERVARDGEVDGEYLASDDKRDSEYVKNGSFTDNYIKGANGGRFDDNTPLNEYERKARKAMQDAIKEFAISPKAKRFTDRGNIPVQAKKEENNPINFIKELGKMIGIDFSSKASYGQFKSSIDYESDYVPDIPMTQMLKSEEIAEIEDGKTVADYPNQTIKIPTKPRRSEFENSVDYYKAIAKWNKLYREIKKHNNEVHAQLLDDSNWIDNIANFITYASNIKAVQENKQILYYLHNMLEKMDFVSRKYGPYGDLTEDSAKSSEDAKVYETHKSRELVDWYDNYLKRLLFDQYQMPTGKLTTLANGLQNFTSANYMMLNIRGGIANVTYGETQILAEAAAKQYFGAKDWAKGHAEWTTGVISFCSNMYKETSTTKQDAIIKYCNIVDYDEINGVVRTIDFNEYSKRLRNWMFSPQTVGEHFMQNSVLFAMLHSHKIVSIDGDKLEIGKTYMNEAEYVRYKLAKELEENVLDAEQREAFAKEKERISKDLNEAKEYAWFRKVDLNQFIYLHCTKEQIDAFRTKEKELSKKYKEEFATMDDMYSQLELGENGKLAFAEGSQLAELDKQADAKGISYANNVMGRFINRARSVNNTIHGIYNRQGAAYIEKYWMGRLIMQYHKHIPTGLLKRYRVRGYFNEMRGTVEKGTYTTLFDFLTMPIDKIKHEANLSTSEAEAVKGIQNIFKYITDYFIYLNMARKVLPDYERANMRRLAANSSAVLATVALTILLQAFWGGDDDDESIPYNLALYELDRLASETFYYTPIGISNETKKLMSTPIAAQSIINDSFKTMTELASMIMTGDDEESYYSSGRFAGQSKYRVFLERRLPGWAGIKAILDTPKNNHYFKVGQNPIGIFNAKEKAESVREYFGIKN